MEILKTVVLAILAFGLGSVPFSVIIGRWFLGKEITDYGDGNPGAANVFRAGGNISGYLAVLLDIGKGIPFVLLSHVYFGLPYVSTVAIGVCAILGHAFTPFLRWRGGKAIAITFGVLIAMPQYETLLAFAALVILGALFIEEDGWTMIMAVVGSLVFLWVTGGESWQLLLMLVILAVFIVKQFESLRSLPGFRGRLIRWLSR